MLGQIFSSKFSFQKTISLLVIVSSNIHVSLVYVTTGLITEKHNFSFAFLDISLLWNIFLFTKKALFPRAILSFISSSIVLSVFTVDPRYLNDLTCSISLFSIFMAFNWSCLLEHFRYFVFCTFIVKPYFRDSFFNFTNVSIIVWTS